MKLLEMELEQVISELEKISSRCYNEEADPIEIGEKIDFVIDDINKLVEMLKGL